MIIRSEFRERHDRVQLLNCFFATWRRVVGYGAPITVIVIRSMQEGVGRSLGALTDYILIGGSQMIDVTDVTHEIGHACYLAHTSGGGNLMFPSGPRGISSWWQVALLRSSRHVTYF